MPDGRGKEFEGMSDEELIEAMTPIMRSVINAAYYRSLGINSLPYNIKPVERYIKLNTEGRGYFYGKIKWMQRGKRFHWLIWEDCDVSNGRGVTFDVHIWGLADGINTVVTRKYWWKAYFIRGMIERQLKLKPEALRVR